MLGVGCKKEPAPVPPDSKSTTTERATERATTPHITPETTPGERVPDQGTEEQPERSVMDGSHTVRIDEPCTLYVANDGNNARDGRTREGALKSPTRAIWRAKPGDVICFARGSYKPFAIMNFEATAEKPLVLRALPGDEHQVVISQRSHQYGIGIRVGRSEHVHLYGFGIERVQSGVTVAGSAHVRIEDLSIRSVGQAGIYVKQEYDSKDHDRHEGIPSHHVDIIGNTIEDTGNLTARYGEGVYVGSGGRQGDKTHDVFIALNRISDVRAEAIDLKPWTSNLIVRGNVILRGSHFFHGAISVGVQAFDGPSANFLIEDNRIYGYEALKEDEKVAGICVGHGNGVVRRNTIWGIRGGSGIRTTTTFLNPEALDVLIEENTIWSATGEPSITLHDGDERTGVPDKNGNITLRDNLTHDGLLGSRILKQEDFVGPISELADAGDGPGSGFVLRSH